MADYHEHLPGLTFDFEIDFGERWDEVDGLIKRFEGVYMGTHQDKQTRESAISYGLRAIEKLEEAIESLRDVECPPTHFWAINSAIDRLTEEAIALKGGDDGEAGE